MFGSYFNHPNSVFYKGYRRQLLATLTVNIIAFSHGITLGWAAPMFYKFQSSDSPLSFPVSVEEISWMGSLISVGGLTGNLLFGSILDRVGRKICFYLLPVPQICLWITIFFASNVYHLYVARILGGMTGGAIFLMIPLFVSEIADNKIRGTLGASFLFSRNLGTLSGYIISTHVSYYLIPCIVLVLPTIYLLCWIRFLETPQHLLRKGRIDAAEISYNYYKNYKQSTTEDLAKITSDFNELKTAIQTIKNEQKLSIRDFCTKRSLKAVGCGFVLVIIYTFSGAFAIINYASMIFAETGSTMDPNTNTIIMGVAQIFGSCCATSMVDKYGRKILLLLSTSGMCLGLTTIGTFSFLSKRIDLSSVTWLPVVIMSFVLFSANISVAFVVLVEILPPKIRSLGTTLFVAQVTILAFTILKVYPILMMVIGLSSVMWISAAIEGLGFFFILIFIRETKGKPLDDDSEYD